MNWKPGDFALYRDSLVVIESFDEEQGCINIEGHTWEETVYEDDLRALDPGVLGYLEEMVHMTDHKLSVEASSFTRFVSPTRRLLCASDFLRKGSYSEDGAELREFFDHVLEIRARASEPKPAPEPARPNADFDLNRLTPFRLLTAAYWMRPPQSVCVDLAELTMLSILSGSKSFSPEERGHLEVTLNCIEKCRENEIGGAEHAFLLNAQNLVRQSAAPFVCEASQPAYWDIVNRARAIFGFDPTNQPERGDHSGQDHQRALEAFLKGPVG